MQPKKNILVDKTNMSVVLNEVVTANKRTMHVLELYPTAFQKKLANCDDNISV